LVYLGFIRMLFALTAGRAMAGSFVLLDRPEFRMDSIGMDEIRQAVPAAGQSYAHHAGPVTRPDRGLSGVVEPG
jgi:hypothetical protein